MQFIARLAVFLCVFAPLRLCVKFNLIWPQSQEAFRFVGAFSSRKLGVYKAVYHRWSLCLMSFDVSSSVETEFFASRHRVSTCKGRQNSVSFRFNSLQTYGYTQSYDNITDFECQISLGAGFYSHLLLPCGIVRRSVHPGEYQGKRNASNEVK